MNKNVGTVCVHGKKQRRNVDNTGAVSFPIYQSATFVHPAFGESTGFDYSRLQNPTREELERVVNDLEEGVDALAFSTGMEAVTALTSFAYTTLGSTCSQTPSFVNTCLP